MSSGGVNGCVIPANPSTIKVYCNHSFDMRYENEASRFNNPLTEENH